MGSADGLDRIGILRASLPKGLSLHERESALHPRQNGITAMLPFVRPILAFLIAPMSTSALFLTIAWLRRSESYYFDQLVILIKISYASEALLGIPCYFFFRRKNLNRYLTYAIWGGAIGGMLPFAILVSCALSSKSCDVADFLSLLALGILLGALPAVVFRIILGKHNMSMFTMTR